MADHAVTIFNERLKATAAAFDRASTAALTVGFLTPTAGLTFQIGGFNTIGGFAGGLIVAAWTMLAFLLHYVARELLNGLKHDAG